MPRVKKLEPAIEVATEPVPTKIAAQYDSDLNAVIFTVNGTKIAIREPNALDFMNLEAWMRSPSKDETEELQKRDVNFIMFKLASLCSIEIPGETKPISYKALCSSLVTFDDAEVVAAAIGHFQSAIAEYFKRIGERQHSNVGN